MFIYSGDTKAKNSLNSLTNRWMHKKSEYLYSALYGIQTTLKRSGMDHSFTCNKHHICCLPRKRSPDGASTDWGGRHLITAHYSFIDPERMKGWVGIDAHIDSQMHITISHCECCVGFVICPIAIAYSMGQIIKSVCVCHSVYPSVSTVTVAFLDRFSPELAQM